MFRRLFSAFPGGLAGIALLLLRTVLGAALVFQAIADFGRAWTLGLCWLISGCLICAGFLTPLVGLAVLAIGSLALSMLPDAVSYMFDSKAAVIFAFTMVLTMIGAGPGRFSVDARVFGRREIIIPPHESER